MIDDFIRLLKQDSIPAQPAQFPRIEPKDRDDLAIVATAITAGGEVLVTGDKELLDLGRVVNLEVPSPRQFWEKLKALQQRGAERIKPRRSR